MSLTREHVRAVFAHLERHDSAGFLAHVADDVHWTVLGTHPLAGEYRSKQAFVSATFERLRRVLKGDSVMTVGQVLVDGDSAAVEMAGRATAANGDPYNNVFCWLCRFQDGKIVRVRAYLDSVLVQQVIERNEG